MQGTRYTVISVNGVELPKTLQSGTTAIKSKYAARMISYWLMGPHPNAKLDTWRRTNGIWPSVKDRPCFREDGGTDVSFVMRDVASGEETEWIISKKPIRE